MLLALLLRRYGATTRARAGESPAEVAAALATVLAAGIVTGRQVAGGAGLERLRAEAESAGLDGVSSAALGALAALNLARARQVARGFAARWRRSTEAGLDPPWRTDLERIAVTENASAFSLARQAAARRIRGGWRVWDAQLDKRTCQTCWRADGTIVAVTQPFPDGEPGGVHPRCRCSWTLLAADEIRGGGLYLYPVA